MREDEAVELIFDAAPFRNVLGHKADKLVVMLFLDHVQELVSNDILHAGERLLGELEVEQHACAFVVAGAPTSFHLFDTPIARLDADLLLPLCYQVLKDRLELFAIPLCHHLMPLRYRALRTHLQDDFIFAFQKDGRYLVLVNQLKAISLTEKVMALPGNIRALSLSFLTGEPSLLTLDPG